MLCSECKTSGHNMRTCPSRKECPVCFEKLGTKNVSVTKCGHEFCTTCLLKATNRNGECPLCRTPLSENISAKTFLQNQERIIKRSLDDFNIVSRFPEMITDDKFKLKIVEDFVYYSHLIFHYSIEELNS
jgi:hypothetical protein